MSDMTGFEGIARVETSDPLGMVTLRADLSGKVIRSAITKATGLSVPDTHGAAFKDATGLCWMSPDELLLLCPHEMVTDRIAALHKALAKHHSMVVDVSDARAVFRVSGLRAREVLAKLCPVDLSVAAFGPGMIRRTRMAQVPAAFWMPDDESFQIVCFRSVGEYMFNLLKTAAQPGSEVGYY